MKTREALETAIQAMKTSIVLAEPQARDWRIYGQALQFNKNESRHAAEYCDRLAEAIVALERLLAEVE